MVWWVDILVLCVLVVGVSVFRVLNGEGVWCYRRSIVLGGIGFVVRF